MALTFKEKEKVLKKALALGIKITYLESAEALFKYAPSTDGLVSGQDHRDNNASLDEMLDFVPKGTETLQVNETFYNIENPSTGVTYKELTSDEAFKKLQEFVLAQG